MEILHTLRRHDFPDCAHAALRHLLACVEGDDNSIPGVGMSNDELAEKIVDEFVFARPALRKSGHQKVSSALDMWTVIQHVVKREVRMNTQEILYCYAYTPLFYLFLSNLSVNIFLFKAYKRYIYALHIQL